MEAVSILLIGVNLGKLHVSNAINLGILLEYVEVVGAVGLSKPTSQPYQGPNTLSVDDSAEEESAIDNVSVFSVGAPQVRPIVVKIAVNGTTIEMEVDTGAAVSLVSERTWKQIRGQVKLQKADVVLRAYNHMRLKVLGEAELQVQYGGRRYELLLRVVKEDGPSLVGRDWLQQIKFDWSAMCHWISPSQSDQMVKTVMHQSMESELYSHMCVLTGQRGWLHLHPEHCHLAREIMHNWKKKLFP